MFEEFYGFREKPFQLAPNPAFLYKSKKHQKALTYLEYGLIENVGFVVLTGEVGSGKTTTAQYVLKAIGEAYDIALIANTNVTADQMLRMIQSEFEISSEDHDKSNVIESLNLFFIDQYRAGKKVLLVIDEAQNLSPQALEEVRMLSNLQSNNYPLLQIMLIGQPELLETLKQPAMKQFTQRIAVHFHLTALDQLETARYIDHRTNIAGGPSGLFTAAALDLIYQISNGIPRAINLICQAALVYGFADEASNITQDIIKQIIDDKIGVGIETNADKTMNTSDAENTPVPNNQERLKTESIQFEMDKRTTDLTDRITQLETAFSEFKGNSQNQLFRLLKVEQRRNIELEKKYIALKKEYDKLVKEIKKPNSKSAIGKHVSRFKKA